MRFRGLLPILPALSLFVSACASAPAPGPGERLDSFFADLHARGLFSGAAVVGDGSRIVWEGGFGSANREAGVAFTPDTPADGASLAKTFTAAIVTGLHREGKLDLDAPAQRLLPELPYPDVTLRHLISHSSGIPVLDYDWFDPFLAPGTVRTTEALLGAIAREKPPLAFAPGSAFEYSSFGFDLAALAAARAAGGSFGALLRDRIFAPLGITSAFLRPARLSDFPAPRTTGYRTAAGAETNEVFDLEAFHGGSNIYISANDLHRWNAAFFDDSPMRPRPPAEALEPARIGGSRSGLTLGSWYYTPDFSAFWYSGHLQGFHAEVFRDMRARRSIVYVSNNTLDIWLQKSIVRAVSAILDGREPELLAPPQVAVVRAEVRDLAAGAWRLSDGSTLTIDGGSDRLSMVRDGVRYRMVQVDPRFFYVPGLDLIAGFATGPDRGFATLFIGSNVASLRGVRE